MRKAILEGLVPEFASPAPFSNQMIQPQAFGRSSGAVVGNNLMMAVNQRPGNGNHQMMSRGNGGQLVVAGSVVGQWGGNYGMATPAGGPHQLGGGCGMMGMARGRGGGSGGGSSGGYRRNNRN